jgi:hypothetical protein
VLRTPARDSLVWRRCGREKRERRREEVRGFIGGRFVRKGVGLGRGGDRMARVVSGSSRSPGRRLVATLMSGPRSPVGGGAGGGNGSGRGRLGRGMLPELS